MKKTISGVLLALTAVFALVACGKKKTTKDSGDDTKTTATPTTKDRKRKGKENIVNAYGWNAEFQTRVNAFYGGGEKKTVEGKEVYVGKKIKSTNGTTTILTDGTAIQWTTATNQGSIYQDVLDTALDQNIVDMFCFEADYATKYVSSEYVADLKVLGVDQSDQFGYTKDIVTVGDKLVGSSWQACPGATIYNMNVAKIVWGDSVTAEQVEAKIAAGYTEFKAAAAEVAAKTWTEGEKTGHYNMIVGPASIYRLYAQNLSAKMYDGKDTITIDKALFEYANNSKEMSGYMAGTTDAFGQWGDNWAAEMGPNSKTLCIFGCPWFVDFSFKGYRKLAEGETNSGWRVCKPYKSFFWGGTWVAATNVSLQATKIKDTVVDIIKDITTNKDIMLQITEDTKDFTNTQTGMNSIKDQADAYFGGSKTIQIYLNSVASANMKYSSDFDQQIAEGFQAAFRTYIGEGAKGKACWDAFVSNLKDKTSVKEVKAAEGVTIADAITIA